MPRFVEAAYFLARRELADQKQVKVRELLAASTKRFPQSPAVTYFNGNFNQLIGDCRAGLQFYDETIALQPLHENALAGPRDLSDVSQAAARRRFRRRRGSSS